MKKINFAVVALWVVVSLFVIPIIGLFILSITSCVSIKPTPIVCDGYLMATRKQCLCLESSKESGVVAEIITLDVPLKQCQDEVW